MVRPIVGEYNHMDRTRQFETFTGFWLTLERLSNKNFILSRSVYIDFVDTYRVKGEKWKK